MGVYHFNILVMVFHFSISMDKLQYDSLASTPTIKRNIFSPTVNIYSCKNGTKKLYYSSQLERSQT